MTRNGSTKVVHNEAFYANLLRSPKVEKLVDSVGADVQAIAKQTAPVDSGDYRDGIEIQHRESRHRRTTRVVGTDPKTMLVEAKTGNLARALRAAKKR